MRKYYTMNRFFIIILLFVHSSSIGQSLSDAVIASAHSTTQSESHLVVAQVGYTVFSTFSNDNTLIIEGVTIDINAGETTTGLNGLAAGEYLDVYPNPAAMDLHISTNVQDIDRFQIFNLHGQKVLEGGIGVNGNESISVETLNKGIYLFTAYDANSRLIKQFKIIKQ